MKKWAVVENGLVVNTILWDGESDYRAGKSQELIEISDLDNNACIGWVYSDGVFYSPPEESTEENALS